MAAFPNKWNRKKRKCTIIIETPKGRRNKFDYDPEWRMPRTRRDARRVG